MSWLRAGLICLLMLSQAPAGLLGLGWSIVEFFVIAPWLSGRKVGRDGFTKLLAWMSPMKKTGSGGK